MNILEKALADGPSENLKPLYNSNVAKVLIVKWSQILISTARSSISGSALKGPKRSLKIPKRPKTSQKVPK